MAQYKVIIVGGGPAGLFTAITLAELGIREVLILEKGKDLDQRDRGDMLCGLGGAGAFSDGKLTLSHEIGGYLGEYLDRETLQRLLQKADDVYVAHGAPRKVYGEATAAVEELSDRAKKAELELVPARIRHMGTENCLKVLKKIRDSLVSRVDIRTNCQVDQLVADDGRIQGVKTSQGEFIKAGFVVVAPGRAGATWMKEQAKKLGLKTTPSPVDIGVRVELPAIVLKEITDVIYESKLIWYSKTFDDKIRTFCMNPYGEVVTEEHAGVITVNGHSYAHRSSENTNFAILVSSMFTEPFDDPIGYGLYIARLANLLGGGIIVQRLGDLLAGRRSTRQRLDRSLTRPTLPSATPGDLSFVFPYRYLVGIKEMLKALDKLAPGVYSRHTLLYGVEVKFYSNRIMVSQEMETQVRNLFAIGDGAGITRGLLQASASGILAALSIGRRMGVAQEGQIP